ncbi:MAG: PLP-dependent transferase [Bacteroidales bacterium]|nr:PLP-dependent transferase [Bacteroidales bacterium]
MKAKNVKSTRTPIYRDAGFLLEDIPTMKKAFVDEINHPHNPDLYIYSRYRNPNVVEAEEHLSKIEGAKWALLTQSGQAALDVALSIFQKSNKPNKWLFFTEIYGGTNSFIDKVLVARRGIEAIRFAPNGDSYSLDAFEKALIETKPEIVFFEALSNPMLIALDGDAVIRIAKKHGAIAIVDNTFATPLLWKPLASGADLVFQSVTKYLSGHGNLSAGAVMGNDPELLKLAIEYRKWVGHMLSPDDAYRLIDMLKTFELRFSRHCQNAFAIANYLNNHPIIEKVLYPGLESHPTHNEANRLFNGKGFGGMVTFDIKGSNPKEKAQRCDLFIHQVANSIALVPTLGDADTILMPVEPVWGDKYPFPGMIRLSVGIEDQKELIKVIGNALDTLK